MNVSAVNFNRNTDNQLNINSIVGAKVNVNASSTSAQTDRIFENVSVGSPMTSTRMDEATKTGLISELDSIKEQVQVSAEAAKSSLKALFKKMDGSAPVLMDESGYNLNDMEPEEVVNVVERIQIMLATYCDDYNGSLSGIDAEEIEAVTGSKVSTADIMSKLESVGAPATKENVQDIKDALSVAEQVKELDANAKLYLVASDSDLTIDNLFKANYGAAKMAGNTAHIDGTQWDSIKSQVEKIIANSGLEVNDKNLDNAKKLVENEIPVDEKHLKMMDMLEGFSAREVLDDTNELLDRIAKNILVGGKAMDTPVVGESEVDTTKELNEVLSKATYNDVAQLTFENKPFTVAQLKLTYMSASYNYSLNESTGKLAATRYEQVMTARMYLMSGVSVRMPDVMNTDISDVVNSLQLQDEMILPAMSMPEKAELLDVRMAAYRISQSSISIVAEGVKNEGVITLNTLSNRVKSAMLTYDAVGTEVRKDLKDSLFKAVEASSESMLNDMDMEDNEENRSAIRILAANNMDVTRESVENIKEQYSEVKRLIDNMKPSTVLNMIRDGLNPMDTDIRVLNDYLEQAGVDAKDERFSRFLYKLDKHHEINATEREQFIGIYKMMNIFTKDAGRAVGAIVNEGAQFTMSNLIANFNAARRTGRSAVVDDTTGLAEISGSVRYFDNLFSAIGAKITPNTLSKTNTKAPIGEYSIEKFCEEIDSSYDSRLEKLDMEGYTDEVKSRVDDGGIGYLLDKSEGITLDNIMAAHELLAQQMNTEFLRKLEPKFKVDINQVDLAKAFASAEEMSDEELSEMYENPAVNYNSFEEIRMQNKEIHLMANLAKKNDYRIPYESDNGVGMIHLQVVEGEEKGKAAVRITRPNGKEASVEITVSDNVLRLYGIDSEDYDSMRSALDRVASSEVVSEMFFDEVKVTAGQSEAVPNPTLSTTAGTIKNSALFAIAKEVISCVLN